MSGFHFRLLHDKSEIAHLQFWTAGKPLRCFPVLGCRTDKSFRQRRQLRRPQPY
jgi:hypothetical protein